jgi:ABC-type transport system involved in multi-copper enzyme maturation permease subunit
MILTQTTAMLVDGYRELNARKLFWITLALSMVMAGAIACIGINDKGISILWWTISADVFNAQSISPATFYKAVFIRLGLYVWLTWIATVLALVSTASIIPEFVAGGSIELSLSKPVGRLRLFLTKYLTGLLFVTAQVSLFSLACFLVIGFRGKSWEPVIFLSIPMVVLFFSYLYSVCALLGLITRSTIAALLITLLFWFVLFVLHAGEQSVRTIQMSTEIRLAKAEQAVAALPDQIERGKTKIAGFETVKADETDEAKASRLSELATEQARVAGLELRLQSQQTSTNDLKSSYETLAAWHRGLFAVKSLLPKTAETMTVLERNLTPIDEFSKLIDAQEERNQERIERRRGNKAEGENQPSGRASEVEAAQKLNEENRDRSLWWVLGTSIIFEVIVLGIACGIFARRDF